MCKLSVKFGQHMKKNNPADGVKHAVDLPSECCKYTCHSQCQHRVVLDCQPGHGSTTETPLSQDQLNNNTQLTRTVNNNSQHHHSAVHYFNSNHTLPPICVGVGDTDV
ncbi:unnamed protein product [Arctogadus glacialis]